MFLIKFLVLVFCLAIFIEDMVSRSVHWFLFPLLYISLSVIGYFSSGDLTGIFHQTLFNTLFIVVQLGILTVYFSVKNQAFTNITKGLLGWGDILFLVSVTAGFSLLNYVLFYMLSLVLVLVIWTGMNAMFKIRHRHVPLAGLQALLFVFAFITEWWHSASVLNNDDWLVNKIISL